MVHGFGRSLVSLAVLALAGGAVAQDTSENFKEAVRLLRMNKDAEARDKLREVLNADPSNEDAFKLLRETDQRIWQLMLEKEGDIAKMARSLMNRARVARKAWSADPAKIDELVKKALGEDFGERRDATMELAAEYGERGAAALIDALGNSDSDGAQTLAILALQGMGRSAVNPLLAALQSDNEVLRRNATAALYYIGDERSLADLKRLVEKDTSAAVKDSAAKAVQRMGGANASAHDLFVKKANDYIAGTIVADGDLTEVVWSLADGKVAGTPVPAAVYPTEMAKNAAFNALELNPASEAGFIALTRAYVHQNKAVEDALLANADDEAMKAAAEKLADSGIAVLGAGPKFLRQAVETDLNHGMVPGAVAGIRLLAKVESPRPAGSPLGGALDHSDSRVQYAAALALAHLDPDGQVASREKVVDILGRAVTEQAVRVVKFIDSDERNRGIAREASATGNGLIIDAGARNGIEGIESLRQFTDVDVVVVNSNLKDITAQDVVRELRENPLTAATKVIVVTANKAEDEKTFGDKVAYIEGPITGDALKAQIDEVLKDVELPGPQKRANEISTMAAEALASLDGTKFDLTRVSDALVKAAGRDDKVAIPALQALGNGGNTAATEQVVAIAADAAKSAPARIAAANAAGDIMARTQSAPQKAIEGLVAIATSDAERGIRAAAVAAIGKAALAPGERAKVMRELRAGPAAGAAKPEGDPADATSGKEAEKTEKTDN